MKCESAWELLCASLDGVLTPAEEKTLQAHLEECPRCRALQAELMGIHTACGELDATVPAELKERILSALPSQKPSKSRHWQRWGAMAAALAIIAMAAWRLPHHLYQGEGDVRPAAGDPVEESAVEPRSGETTTQATGAYDFMGYDDTVADEIPPYVDGQGVNVNAYVPSPAATKDTDAPAETAVYKAFRDETELGAAKLFKVAQAPVVSDLTESVDTDAETGVAVQGDADGGVEPVLPAMGSRTTTAPAEDGLFTGGVDTAVPETAPVMNEAEWSVAAEPLETATEELDPFATYCGVLTLETYDPQRSYPSLLMENGEVWYALPAEDFAVLVEDAEGLGISHKLLLSGDNISPDAPEGLVVVEPLYIP